MKDGAKASTETVLQWKPARRRNTRKVKEELDRSNYGRNDMEELGFEQDD